MTDIKREDCRCGQRGRLWACGQIDCPWASKFFNDGRLTLTQREKKPHTTFPWAVGARGRVFWTDNKRPKAVVLGFQDVHLCKSTENILSQFIESH